MYKTVTSINLVHLEYQNDVASVVQTVDNAIHWINTLAYGGKELLGPWRPNGHHDYGLGAGAGAGAVENAADLSTFFLLLFPTFDMKKLRTIRQLH